MSAKASDALRATEASAARVSAALGRVVASVETGKADAVRYVTAGIMRQVALATPVDTGRMRAAWEAGLREVGLSPVPATGPNVDPKAIAKGRREGYARTTETPDLIEIEIVNGVRYAPFIEAGTSKQAPAGVVRPVLDRWADDLLKSVGAIETDGVR